MVRAAATKVMAEEREEEEAPIHGDILEAILSHVPLIHLAQASHVSKPWKRAVSSSLRHCNKLKPWLIVHTQGTHLPYSTSTRAYDPRSRVWIEIQEPSIRYIAALRTASHSNLLYMLSPSKLSFSFDPLHLTWHNIDAPLVWRTDPIVSLVGRRIVVAGGTCDFEDEPLAVEIYDTESRAWDTCNSMPAVLRDSAASTWLSIASNDRLMFVMGKCSGRTYTFDPESKNWYGPYLLRPDPNIFYSAIAYMDDRLILVGMIGDSKNAKPVKVWEVDSESFTWKLIGEMPINLVEKMKSQNKVSSMNVCFAGNFMYIYNPSEAEEVVMCELVGGGCRWGSVLNVVAGDRNLKERMVISCSEIAIDDVSKALRLTNRKFAVTELR